MVEVDDGEVEVRREALGDATQAPRRATNGAGPEVDTIVRVSVETWRRLLSGELAPTAAAEMGLTQIEGELHPATLFGRWADRAAGIDGPELEREAASVRSSSAAPVTWGSAGNGRRARRPATR